MSTEKNKDIVLQFYGAFDNRNIDQGLAILADNFVAHIAGVPNPLNSDVFKQFGLAFYNAFPDGKHAFEQVIVEADKVVTCGTFTGTHLGEFQGLPPTGKQVKFSVMHIDRVAEGKIVEHWGQGDTIGLMQQLGIVPIPGLRLISQMLKSGVVKLLDRLFNR